MLNTENNKYISPIEPFKGFEIVELPTSLVGRYGEGAKYAKLAYGKIYPIIKDDLEIQLDRIRELEISGDNNVIPDIKQAYKIAISILSDEIRAGWNYWSECILELFLAEQLHKVIWGSGNCGKSIIMGLLLYLKWRVNPQGRMVVIASSVLQDSAARVFGYIKGIHVGYSGGSDAVGMVDMGARYSVALATMATRFTIIDTAIRKGIFVVKTDPESGKDIIDDRACIISLPVKVNAKRGETGSNLIGKHPRERLILAFDEAQELEGRLLGERVFLNWYTNAALDVYAWGNPSPVDWNREEGWDMLFKMGADQLGIGKLRELEGEARSTGWWNNGKDTKVLHLSMLDSPKDTAPTEQTRLAFLAGKDNVARILEAGVSETSTAFYSQVLGFPYVDSSGKNCPGVISPAIVATSKEYPLRFVDEGACKWFMGVDSSGTGHGDETSICIGRIGIMIDGRTGIDLMGGKACHNVSVTSDSARGKASSDNTNFTDEVVDTIYKLSIKHKIRLGHIAIESHGSGEVLRYAIQKKISDGYWKEDVGRGDSVLYINPTIACTDRPMFKVLGKMEMARDVCTDINTEMWLAIRCCFLSKQIFNVPEVMLRQMYGRILDKNSSNIKYKLESKRDMRKRGVKSPNDTDALANMLEIMRVRGGFAWKFVSGGYYTEKYGRVWQESEAKKVVGNRLGMASRLLGLEGGIGVVGGFGGAVGGGARGFTGGGFSGGNV